MIDTPTIFLGSRGALNFDLEVNLRNAGLHSGNWGEEGLSPNEQVFGWNSFAVLAMKSGIPEKPVNAILGSGRATCQLRYVFGTKANNIIPALRKHLDQHGFEDVQLSSDEKFTFAATR